MSIREEKKSGGMEHKFDVKFDVISLPPSSMSRPKRLTTRYGSKYEKARLLGEWATQVSQGADPCIDLSKIPEKDRHRYTDPLAIAQKAFEDKTMPLGIRRYLPDGSHEDWRLNELSFD